MCALLDENLMWRAGREIYEEKYAAWVSQVGYSRINFLGDNGPGLCSQVCAEAISSQLQKIHFKSVIWRIHFFVKLSFCVQFSESKINFLIGFSQFNFLWFFRPTLWDDGFRVQRDLVFMTFVKNKNTHVHFSNIS